MQLKNIRKRVLSMISAKKSPGYSRLRRAQFREDRKLLLLLLPFLVILIMFKYVPLFGWILSLYEYHAGTPIFKNEFVGLKYFRLIFKDYSMAQVIKNTLVFSVTDFVLQILPMLFAILLNEVRSRRFKKFTQTITTLPHFISWIIVYSLCFSLFSTDGLLNKALLDLNIITKPLQLLSNAKAVYPFHIILLRWKELGWKAIIYIAALSGIDDGLYEAARIDGAGRFALVWHITIPSLMPTFLVLLILSVSNFVNVGFDQFFVFNNALVARNIEVLDLYTYRVGLQQFDYSYATAVGIFKSAISIALLFTANALSRRARGESII